MAQRLASQANVPVEQLVARLYQGAWADAPADRPFGAMELVGDPDQVAAVLGDPETFTKEYDLLTELGHSRFDARGQDWADRRDLTQPILREAALKRHHAAITARYGAHLDTLRAQPPASRSSRMDHAILSAATEITLRPFGGQTAGPILADWILEFRKIARVAQTVAMFGATQAEVTALRSRVADMRAELRALLSADDALMKTLDAMGARMADRAPDPSQTPFEPLTEFIFVLLAGTETTAATLSWCLTILAKFPAEQERLAAAAISQGSQAEEVELLVQEALRFFPPVPILTRRVGADTEIAGRPVRRGSVLALDIIRLHHDHRYWDRPKEIQFQRTAFRERSWTRRAYLPFSAGARVCGGTGLARAELHGGLAEILKRFHIKGPSDLRFDMEYALNLRPRSLAPLQLEDR